jgi:hypothetical protein
MLQAPMGWFQGLCPWRVQGRALALPPFTRLPLAENGHEVYLGNPERRTGARPSDDASANS